MRRIKVLRISGAMLFGIFGEGDRAYRVMKDGIPPDAKVVFAEWDFLASELHVLLESEQFPETPTGQAYPELCPVFHSSGGGRPDFAESLSIPDHKPLIREISLMNHCSQMLSRYSDTMIANCTIVNSEHGEPEEHKPYVDLSDEPKTVKFREFL